MSGFTPVEFARGEFRLVVNNAPARICQSCGEAYVDEEVAVHLLQSAQEIYRTGLLEAEIGYESL